MSSPSSGDTVISVVVSADQDACVCLIGEFDVGGEPQLDSLARQLAVSACIRVYIDLAGVTFAGSTFVNFVFGLTSMAPRHHQLILCRPTLSLRRVIALTSLDRHTEIRGDLPPGWTFTPNYAGARSPLLASASASV